MKLSNVWVAVFSFFIIFLAAGMNVLPVEKESSLFIKKISKALVKSPIDEFLEKYLTLLENSEHHTEKQQAMENLIQKNNYFLYALYNSLNGLELKKIARENTADTISGPLKKDSESHVRASQYAITALATSKSGSSIALATSNNKIYYFDSFNDKAPRRIFEGPCAGINSLSLLDDSIHILSTSSRALLNLHDGVLKELEPVRSAHAIQSVNGKFLVAQHFDQCKLSDLLHVDKEIQFSWPYGKIKEFAINDKGNRAVIATHKKYGIFLDCEKLQATKMIKHSSPITSVDISSPYGRVGLSVSSSGMGSDIITTDLDDNKESLIKSEHQITIARFSPCAKLIITGAHDGNVTLYKLRNDNRHTVCNYGKPIRCISFNGDGKTVAISSDNALFVNRIESPHVTSAAQLILLLKADLFGLNTVLKTPYFKKTYTELGSDSPLKLKMDQYFIAQAGECCICRDDLMQKDQTQKLSPCGHDQFHAHCIEQWKEIKMQCPLCRANLVTPNEALLKE